VVVRRLGAHANYFTKLNFVLNNTFMDCCLVGIELALVFFFICSHLHRNDCRLSLLESGFLRILEL